MRIALDNIPGLNIEDEPMPKRPEMDAQRMELRSRFERSRVRSPLKEGDLVREKQGLFRLHPGRKDEVQLMLWRILDEADWRDRLLIETLIKQGYAAHSRVDCVLVHTDTDGSGLTPLLHELSHLELMPEVAP